MNLDFTNYSYVNALGNTLKQPLFKLVSNIAKTNSYRIWAFYEFDNPTFQTAKVALQFFITTLFILPAGAMWFVGKTITYLGKPKINYKCLSLAPLPFQIPKESPDERNIDILTLYFKFVEIEPNKKKQEKLLRLCNCVTHKHTDIFPGDQHRRNLFCKEISIYLKKIIKKIDSGELSKEQEKAILKELGLAADRCYQTWFAVSEKLYRDLYVQPENAGTKLFRFVQEYKENIILEFADKEYGLEWHALTYVRNILGNELGLNTTLNGYDNQAAQNDTPFAKFIVKWLFLQKYENPHRLISSIHATINLQYDPSYFDFLVELTKRKGIRNPQDYVKEHFFTEDYKLTKEATYLMLQAAGILE